MTTTSKKWQKQDVLRLAVSNGLSWTGPPPTKHGWGFIIGLALILTALVLKILLRVFLSE